MIITYYNQNMGKHFVSQSCSKYIISNNSQQILSYQLLSGLGLNKLGQYADCIEIKQNQYYLVEYIFPQNEKFMSGLCFHEVCSADDIKYLINSAKNYAVDIFEVKNVIQVGKMDSSIDFLAVLVISLFAVLSLLTIFCTVRDLIERKNNNGHLPFSIITSLKVLSSHQPTSNKIRIFSGLKFVSLLGIIFSNLAAASFNDPTTSFQPICFYFMLIFAYFQDIWLSISGFYHAYFLIKSSKQLGLLGYLQVSFRRILRLWPLYMLSLFLNWKFISFSGKGPLFPLVNSYPERCSENYYLQYFLMVSNFFPNKCYNWLWLLQIDLQLFIFLTPFILLFRKYRGKIQSFFLKICAFVLIIVSISMAFFHGQKYSIQNFFISRENSQKINCLPITHIGGYLVGVFFGIIFGEFRKARNKEQFWLIKILKNKIKRLFSNTVALGLLAAIIYSFYLIESETITITHYLYFHSLHTLFPLLIFILILPCLFGFHSPLKLLLQSKIEIVVSKMSLSIFIVSYSFAIRLIYTRQNDLEMTSFMLFFMTVCCFMPCFVLAVVIHSLFEIPIFMMIKKITKNRVAALNFIQH